MLQFGSAKRVRFLMIPTKKKCKVVSGHIDLCKRLPYLFIYRGKIHMDRRMFLRTALRELELILTDQPGLLGPKVSSQTWRRATVGTILHYMNF